MICSIALTIRKKHAVIMMELMTILVIHLMLAGWIQHTDATDCTLHVSSQSPKVLSLQCSNSLCQLKLQTPQGENCYSNYSGANCYIDNCNQVYNICSISQNQSSPRCRELSNGGQGAHNSDPPINCTVDIVPQRMEIYLTCPKGECQHRAIARGSNYTACSRNLRINCENHTSCTESYSIYTTTEVPITTEAQLTTNEPITSEMTCTCPNPTVTASSEISTIASNQTCNKTVSIQSCPNTVTFYSSPSDCISTMLYSTVCPTSTIDPTASETTNVASTPTEINPSSSSICSPASVRPILLIIIPAAGGTIGLLIVLLLVVITGWVCTCRIMKKRGKMEINIMQDSFPNRVSTADDRQTYTRTQQRFDDNPLCKEHATPPQAHPNPPQQQRYDDNPFCKEHATPPQAHPNPPQQQKQEHLYSISLATKRKEPTHQNIPNGLNRACSGGGVSVGGATQIPRKQEKIEHEYDHLVKVVKQTEGGQSKRDERISFERNQKYHTSDKQERATTLQYQTQEYLTPIKQESKRFQNRPNKGSFQAGGASVGVGVPWGEIEHQYDHLVKNVKKKDNQRKRDEGIDEGEMDHDYHELEGAGDDYDYPEEKERDIVYHVLDGPTPIETDLKTFQNRPNKVYPGGGVSMGGATQFPWKQKPCDHQYDHLIKAAKKKGGQGRRDEGADAERDHGYHVLEGPPGVDVDDYDYPAEREGPEMVYHVLDGSTPVEEETQFIY